MRQASREKLARHRRTLLLAGALMLFAATARAMPLSEYQKHLEQAIVELDSLGQIDPNETASAHDARRAEIILSVQQLLPAQETVELHGATFSVDNHWLQQELDKYKNAPTAEKAELRAEVSERLVAIAERLKETEPVSANDDKAEHNKRLAEILRRPERRYK